MNLAPKLPLLPRLVSYPQGSKLILEGGSFGKKNRKRMSEMVKKRCKFMKKLWQLYERGELNKLDEL